MHTCVQKPDAKEFYRQMFLIRHIEEKILDGFSRGLFSGTTHTSIGQEACSVGVVNALDRRRDIIFSNHRGHGHFLAYCGDVAGLVGELAGTTAGVCRGIGGSQHLQRKNFYSNGIQGGIVPCAAGMALAEKIKQTGALAAVFIGDGTLAQGVVYETMNISALWSLPVLFVVEHNGYAQSTPTRFQHAGNLAARAIPFGIESAEVKADDVFTVYEAALQAVKRVRENKPFFLLLHTYRLAPHSKGDDFRDPTEIEKFRAMDPLARLKKELDPGVAERIEKEVAGTVDRAFADACNSPRLKPASFLSEVNLA